MGSAGIPAHRSNDVKTTAKISNNNIRFIEGSYNGLKLLIKTDDHYINATIFCEQYNKRFRNLQQNTNWKDYVSAEAIELGPARFRADQLVYDINKGFDNEYK
ncbi:MAG: hypothetical protein EZS28_055547, partial [Streblomastix strix]